MRIGLDVSGGDFAPEAVVLGAIKAFALLQPNQKLVLIGSSSQVIEICQREKFDVKNFELIPASEVIGMEESPTKAITKKTNSSIVIGFHLLKEGKIDSFASAGNTGAMLVGALFSVQSPPKLLRPCMPAIFPRLNGDQISIVLDIGVNSDCKPEMFPQFGILGQLFAQNIYGIKEPKVGLLNIGEEEGKGNLLYQTAYPLMKDALKSAFVGNLEGRELFSGKGDIVVADGFTGNVVIKFAESFYAFSQKKKIKDPFIDRLNYELYGGCPILGVNAPVVIGHGISSPEAIKNMLLLSRDMIQSQLVDKIKAAFS